MRQTIALAGVGNLGKYACEELLSSPLFEVIVITRQKTDTKWLQTHNIPTHQTDYTTPSILSILNTTQAKALISFSNCPPSEYTALHTTLLTACTLSKTCKRFIPSEWSGNIDDFPLLPRFYGSSREPFRKILEAETARGCGVEWTLFNNGWLIDYFLPERKTHMSPAPDDFPIDANGWKACIRGSGDEPQAWTLGRDVGKAVVALLQAPEWEKTTYIAGEWSTFNAAILTLESFYNKPLPKTHIPASSIHRLLATHTPTTPSTPSLDRAQLEEWMLAGASAPPQAKTLRQREKYFSGVEFVGLEELLRRAERVEFL